MSDVPSSPCPGDCHGAASGLRASTTPSSERRSGAVRRTVTPPSSDRAHRDQRARLGGHTSRPLFDRTHASACCDASTYSETAPDVEGPGCAIRDTLTPACVGRRRLRPPNSSDRLQSSPQRHRAATSSGALLSPRDVLRPVATRRQGATSRRALLPADTLQKQEVIDIVARKLEHQGLRIHEPVVFRGTDCLFASVCDALESVVPALDIPVASARDVRRRLSRRLRTMLGELQPFLPAELQSQAAWDRRCSEYAAERMGDVWILRAAAVEFRCRVHVVGRGATQTFQPDDGVSTYLPAPTTSREIVLAYFDAVDYLHYASTRKISGAGGNSRRSADAASDASERGPGRERAGGSAGGGQDGGDVNENDSSDEEFVRDLTEECGGMTRSDIQRLLEVVEWRSGRIQSVLSWLAAPAGGDVLSQVSRFQQRAFAMWHFCKLPCTSYGSVCLAVCVCKLST